MRVDRVQVYGAGGQLWLLQELRVDCADLKHAKARTSLKQLALAQHLHHPSARLVECGVERRRLLVGHHTANLCELRGADSKLRGRARHLHLCRDLVIRRSHLPRMLARGYLGSRGHDRRLLRGLAHVALGRQGMEGRPGGITQQRARPG
eukprot:scaffold61357_cov75-Phaeocystis_antarctica.AAC.4